MWGREVDLINQCMEGKGDLINQCGEERQALLTSVERRGRPY